MEEQDQNQSRIQTQENIPLQEEENKSQVSPQQDNKISPKSNQILTNQNANILLPVQGIEYTSSSHAILNAHESDNIGAEDANLEGDGESDDHQNLLDKSDLTPVTKKIKSINQNQNEEMKVKHRSPMSSPSRYQNNTSQQTPAEPNTEVKQINNSNKNIHTSDFDYHDQEEEEKEKLTEEMSFKGNKMDLPLMKGANSIMQNNRPWSIKQNSASDNIQVEMDMDIEEEKKHEDGINAPYNFNQKPKQMIVGGASSSADTQPLQQAYKAHLIQGNNQNVEMNNPAAQKQKNQASQGGKFTEFLIAEKQRKFVRLPRVYGKRVPMTFKCPQCKTDKEQRTKLKYECTGNQWCACIVFCFFACYPLCCVPFCIKRCYNVKHLCPQCYYQVGESGI